METSGAKLTREGESYPLDARVGDVLFKGDRLRGSAAFLYCPARAAFRLGPNSEVVIEGALPKARVGAVTRTAAANSCFLPELPRLAVASLQHYGGHLTRPMPAGPVATPSLAEAIAGVPEPRRSTLTAELAAVDQAIAASPDDVSSRIARAVLLDQAGIAFHAASEYRRVLAIMPDATWILSRLFALDLRAEPAQRPVPAPTAGKTFALLIGISKYRSDQITPLLFADRDAMLFESFLRSDRGGSVRPSEIVTLTNEGATTAAIRLAFTDFLRARMGPDDNAVILIAAHGAVQEARRREAYIVTHDTDPQDLAGTALPMSDLKALFEAELSRVKRVTVYLDACHAGTLGVLKTSNIHSTAERLTEAEGELFTFMASGKDEVAHEGPQFGGGHGAFSYFVLDAMNGSADRNSNKEVEFNEFVEYVRQMVSEATGGKQHPRERGDLGATTLASMAKAGLDLPRWIPPAEAVGGRTRQLPSIPSLREFRAAIAEGSESGGNPAAALTLLNGLRAALSPAAFREEENRLRVFLENAGQAILLRYLAGERVPQTREDFASCAALYETAVQLTPESMLLSARRTFCEGRVALFDKQYSTAARLLERSIRLDGATAFAYNALGIALLEMAEYPRAILALRDAIARSPSWAYAWHNLALAYLESGNSPAAIQAYQEAARLAPRFAYLPYSLGLAYLRINRRKEAEAMFRRALTLEPDLAAAHDALGLTAASNRKLADAERHHRRAIELAPTLSTARHNLALLLAAQPSRAGEAVPLWRENLARDPAFLPSRFSLARHLASRNDRQGALAEYRALVAVRPDFVAAWIAIADILAASGQHGDAALALSEAGRLQPSNLAIQEKLADVYAAAGNGTEARRIYEQLLRRELSRAKRKSLLTRLMALSKP
jgi:tetratricopeptide (TPR) repeat protein